MELDDTMDIDFSIHLDYVSNLDINLGSKYLDQSKWQTSQKLNSLAVHVFVKSKITKAIMSNENKKVTPFSVVLL